MAEQGPQSPQAAASQRGTGHEGRRHLRHRSSLSGHGRPWPRGDTVTLPGSAPALRARTFKQVNIANIGIVPKPH